MFGLRRETWGWILALVLPVAIFFWLHDVAYTARVTMAITAGALALWILEPIPFAMTSMLVIAVLPMAKAVSLDTMLSGFGAPAVFLAVAGMMMAKGVEETSLGKRVAFFLLSRLGNRKGGILAGVILVPQVLSFFIPAAAVRTTMFLPIAVSILSLLNISKEHPMARQLMMGVAIGCGISGVGVLPAAIGNLITVDIIQMYLQQEVTYVHWLLVAGPLWLLLIVAAWITLQVTMPAHMKTPADLRQQVQAQLAELGPLTAADKRAMAILVLTMLLWVFQPLHGWPLVIPAIVAVILMALPKIGIADWVKLVKVDFGTILLLGSTLSLGRALMESGAIEVMLHQIQHPVVERLFMQPLLAVLAVAVLTQLVHKVTTNVSTAVICIVPIVIAIAQDVGASAYMLAIVAGITSLLGFVFVVETIPSVIVQQAGYMTQKELLCPGLVLTIVSVVLTVLVAMTWWMSLGYL